MEGPLPTVNLLVSAINSTLNFRKPLHRVVVENVKLFLFP